MSETMAKPPGARPIIAADSLTSLLLAWLSPSTYPAKAKSRRAIRMGLAARRYISMMTTERSTPRECRHNRAPAEITRNSGAPEKATRISKTVSSSVILSGHRGPH